MNNPWIQWMQSMQAPFSHYDQNISPVTTWFSPTYEINYAGDQEIEAKITQEVASFGTQLGALSAAVMELAEGNQGEAVEELKQISAKIAEAKAKVKSERPNQLAASLKNLQENDKAAFDELMKQFK